MRRKWHWLLGLLSKRSCYTLNGKPKIRYGSRDTALRAAEKLSISYGKPMDAYRCWFRCRKWHVGRAA